MDVRMTCAEQNLLLLEGFMPANERFYVWCYTDDGQIIAASCPEKERAVLDKCFQLFGGLEKGLSYLKAKENVPLLIGSPIGMQWAVTTETERGQSLLFVMGPVFYSVPVEAQIREVLSPYRNTPRGAEQVRNLLAGLPSMPVIPHAIFIRYVTMVHNVLTGQQRDVSDLFSGPNLSTGSTVPAPEKRDRSTVYLAERSMLKMVRDGDINYQRALNVSSSLSPGVPVQGRDPLQQNRISIIVFTTLVSRAAMEGGMSPEEAYALGDSYIEAAVNSNDTGELNMLALTMYHDFIYRMHHLHANPNYSFAIQKCCDYISLSLERKIEIADLAALTGYTEYYLTEKFKKETGVPLFLYIRHAKIERAKVYLESSDLSVKEIAEQLAFNTPNYFIKCFHEVTGYSPAQYRRQFKKR